jgi:hypothetical protein
MERLSALTIALSDAQGALSPSDLAPWAAPGSAELILRFVSTPPGAALAV